LDSLYKAVADNFWKLPWVGKREEKLDRNYSDQTVIISFMKHFHQVVRQLKHRHADRPAFLVQDEYDVQDILHSFLRGLFDDVRSEEYTPSYVGGASRMDFLLKKEQIVIETKMASLSLRDRQVGEQLMIDIQRYQAHPDCKNLICFVYDPNSNINNPTGLERDLSKVHDKLKVQVIVVSV
jgi:hypothetical protein